MKFNSLFSHAREQQDPRLTIAYDSKTHKVRDVCSLLEHGATDDVALIHNSIDDPTAILWLVYAHAEEILRADWPSPDVSMEGNPALWGVCGRGEGYGQHNQFIREKENKRERRKEGDGERPLSGATGKRVGTNDLTNICI